MFAAAEQLPQLFGATKYKYSLYWGIQTHELKIIFNFFFFGKKECCPIQTIIIKSSDKKIFVKGATE